MDFYVAMSEIEGEGSALSLQEEGGTDVLFENFNFTGKLSTWFVEVLDYCRWMLLLLQR